MRSSAQPPAVGIARGARTAAIQYGLAAAVSLVAAFVLLELWKAALWVPFDYQGDALASAMLVQSILKNGWYLVNPQLGAPGVFELHDYPLSDGVHLLLIELLGAFSAKWAVVLNLYFLLGFPLIAVSALAVFRHLRIPFHPALVASTLFAFLPSRLIKGEGHLFLDVYFQVPLAILVVLWVCGEAPPLVRARAGDRAAWPALDLRRRRSIAALSICLLTASTGLYYACFAGGLLLVAGAWASIRGRTATHATAAVLLAATLAAGVALNGLPTLIHRHHQGPNPEVGHRLPGESDRYGLRVTQLLLPVDGHRIEALRKLKDRYNAGGPGAGEGSAGALGFLGSLGFLWLLSVSFGAGPRASGSDPLPARLATLNLSAVLIATIGGFGPLFAFLVTPQIRSWARMNVVIGFLSLCALALLLDRLGRGRRRLALFLPPVVLVAGLLDQASLLAVRPYGRTIDTYRADARFVRGIEATLPPAAMVFQLPYRSFPETPPQHRLRDYDPLRPYLHARTLRWSYPTMRGRRDDLWATAVVARPLPEMVETLSDAGFAGILVDRAGYPDGAAGMEAALTTLLQVRPTVSDHARFAFFPMAGYSTRTSAGRSPAERERRRTRALHPLLLRWGPGCYGLEAPADRAPFRWCQRTGELQIINGAPTPRPATLSMTLVPASAPARWTVTGALLADELALTAAGTPYTRRILVPPGTHTLHMTATNPPVHVPSDPRTMVWRAEAPTLREEAAGDR